MCVRVGREVRSDHVRAHRYTDMCAHHHTLPPPLTTTATLPQACANAYYDGDVLWLGVQNAHSVRMDGAGGTRACSALGHGSGVCVCACYVHLFVEHCLDFDFCLFHGFGTQILYLTPHRNVYNVTHRRRISIHCHLEPKRKTHARTLTHSRMIDHRGCCQQGCQL